MARRGKQGRGGPRRSRKMEIIPRRRLKVLDGLKSVNIDDYDFLRQFVTEHGKILPARMTGASAKYQRAIKRGIRRGRVMGLVG